MRDSPSPTENCPTSFNTVHPQNFTRLPTRCALFLAMAAFDPLLPLGHIAYDPAMRHSSLASFLNGQLSPDELWREIEKEVTECRAACAKGGSGHVILTDGPDTQVSPNQAATLLTALTEGTLPLASASYIADALIMSDDFEWEDEAVSETLFFLSDESAPLTLASVEEARIRLERAG